MDHSRCDRTTPLLSSIFLYPLRHLVRDGPRVIHRQRGRVSARRGREAGAAGPSAMPKAYFREDSRERGSEDARALVKPGNRTPHTDPLSRGALVGLTLKHGRGHVFLALMESVAFGSQLILDPPTFCFTFNRTPHLLQGNRTPHTDPLSRGALVGLTLKHGRGHVFRALMESVAFGTELILDTMRRNGFSTEQITIAGGATKSQLWLKLHADVSNLPFRRRTIWDYAILAVDVEANMLACR
eukprot:gene30475-35488_t